MYLYIYICICSCPSPSSILFQRDPKTPSRRSSNLRCKIPISVLTLQMPFCIQQIPELLMQEIMYAMHTVSAPCHGTTLHPATKGVRDPHSGWSRRGTAQGGKGVWWVGFLTISKYFIKYLYIYIFIIQTNEICFKKSIYIQNRGKPESAKRWKIFMSILFD